MKFAEHEATQKALGKEVIAILALNYDYQIAFRFLYHLLTSSYKH